MENIRNDFSQYRRLLSGDIVQGIQVDVLPKQSDNIEYTVERLVWESDGEELFTLEHSVSTQDANGLPQRVEKVCHQMRKAHYYQPEKKIVRLDEDVFVEQQVVERSDGDALFSKDKFTVFMASKLNQVDHASAREHELKSVKRRGQHILLQFAENIDLKPMISVVCFRPSGMRFMISACFPQNTFAVVSGETPFQNELFAGDAINDPPRVILESIDVSSRLLHVMKERPTNGSREHSCRSVHGDNTNVDIKNMGDEKVISPTLTRTWKPTTSAQSQPPYGATRDPLIDKIAKLPIAEVVDILVHKFSRAAIKDAFREVEPRTVPSLNGTEDISSVREDQVSMAESMPPRRSSEELDPLFSPPDVGTSATTLHRPDVAKVESTLAIGEITSAAVMGEAKKMRTSFSDVHSERPESECVSTRSIHKNDESSSNRDVMCFPVIDSSMSESEMSIAESYKTSPDLNRKSPLFCGSLCSANLTRSEIGQSSRKSAIRKSILPVRIGKKNSAETGSKLEIEEAVAHRTPTPSIPETTPSNAARTEESYSVRILHIAENAKKKGDKLAVLVRDDERGDLLENFFISQNYRAAFFPPRTLRNENFREKVDPLDVLVTTPPVWKDLSPDRMVEVAFLVNSSEGVHEDRMEEINRKYRQLHPDIIQKIERKDIPFVASDIHVAVAATTHTSEDITRPTASSDDRFVPAVAEERIIAPSPMGQSTVAYTESIADADEEKQKIDRLPYKEYPVKLTQKQHQVVDDCKDAIKKLIKFVNNYVSEKGIDATNPAITNERATLAFAGGLKEWMALTTQKIPGVEKELQGRGIDLMRALIDCATLVPLIGVQYAWEMVRRDREGIDADSNHYIPSSLKDCNEYDCHDIESDSECFSTLIGLLQKFQSNKAFHGIIYTLCPLCINAISERLSNCSSLKSWLCITRQFASSGDRQYKMSKTKRNDALTKFTTAEKAVLVVCGQYRDLINGEVVCDAVFFYGIRKGKDNDVPLPPKVCTISHDLM